MTDASRTRSHVWLCLPSYRFMMDPSDEASMWGMSEADAVCLCAEYPIHYLVLIPPPKKK